jgi:DNA-binding MarR family transcriptional regulator
MRDGFAVMQESAGSLAPGVVAELLKVNRLLAHGGRPLNKNGRRRIGPTQGRVLAFLLSRSPDPITLTSLADGAALSPATASETVRALKAKGFVRKVRSKDDARVVYLSLSAAGRRKAERAVAGSKHLNAAIERLPYREQELFFHALKNLQQAMNLGERKP